VRLCQLCSRKTKKKEQEKAGHLCIIYQENIDRFESEPAVQQVTKKTRRGRSSMYYVPGNLWEWASCAAGNKKQQEELGHLCTMYQEQKNSFESEPAVQQENENTTRRGRSSMYYVPGKHRQIWEWASCAAGNKENKKRQVIYALCTRKPLRASKLSSDTCSVCLCVCVYMCVCQCQMYSLQRHL